MPYYESQTGWGKNEYYCLHRYMHKMIIDRKKRLGEIEKLDVTRMTNETRVILYCIIMYYGFEDLLEMDNMQPLKKTKPLEKPLIIDGDTVDEDIYKEMNVYF